MKQRPRIYYSATQRALIWERWRKGETLHQIAGLFDRHHSSIQRIVAETGGVRPADRRRSRWALTLSEREEISRAVVAGHSIRSIAASLGRAPSTISREIRRHGGPGGYRASRADQAAWDRARRPKVCKLVQSRSVGTLIASKLCLEWSPEQIAGWLKRTYPDDETYQVSHETIYRSLFIQARGALKKELLAALAADARHAPLAASHAEDRAFTGEIARCGIDQRTARRRPRIAPYRATGRVTCCSAAHNSQIATLVERQSRYVMLVKVASKDTETVVDALIKNTRKLPHELYTVAHLGSRQGDGRIIMRFTLATDIEVYFCDPQQPLATRLETRTRTACSGNICPKGIDLSSLLTIQAQR